MSHYLNTRYLNPTALACSLKGYKSSLHDSPAMNSDQHHPYNQKEHLLLFMIPRLDFKFPDRRKGVLFIS